MVTSNQVPLLTGGLVECNVAFVVVQGALLHHMNHVEFAIEGGHLPIPQARQQSCC